MRKLLILIMLFCYSANAQYIDPYGFAWKMSELKWYNGTTAFNAIALVNDFRANGTGGVYRFCDTCTHVEDSVTYIGSSYNGWPTLPYMWVKISEVPMLPNMTGQSGKYLKANALVPEWATLPNQVNSDWNSGSGVSQILNKPTIPTNNNQLSNGSNYYVTPSGTTGQYVRGNGTLATFPATKYLSSMAISGVVNKIITATMSNGDTVQTPAMKIPVTYSGTTNSSGIYAVTFPTAYSVAPNIQANPVAGNNKWSIIPTVTTTGFSIYVQLRTDIVGLLPTYSNVNGANIDVIITEK